MLAMPLLGWAMLSAAGDPARMTGDWVLPPIAPRNPALYAALRWAHGALGYALFATVLVHISAPLRHAWVLRDGVFQAMVPVAGAVDAFEGMVLRPREDSALDEWHAGALVPVPVILFAARLLRGARFWVQIFLTIASGKLGEVRNAASFNASARVCCK